MAKKTTPPHPGTAAGRAKDPKTGLTPLMTAFVREYPKDQNATQAYQRAKVLVTGRPTTPETAQNQGAAYLRISAIQRALAKVTARVAAKADLSAERVLEEIRRLAMFDVGALFTDDGKLRPIHTLSAEERSAVASLEVARVNLIPNDGAQEWLHKVKTWDKTKALEMLAKYHKLLTDVVQIEGDWDKLAARLASARKREP